MPWILTITDTKKEAAAAETNLQAGQRLYTNNCMSCHGANGEGSGNNPTLIDVNKKYTPEQFTGLITTGRRMMPAFARLAESEKQAIASYLLDNKHEQKQKFVAPSREEDSYYNIPYTSTGYNKFLTKDGYPAVAPPWGTLNAINLNTGETVWKDTLGEYPELIAKGIPPTGTENYGGPAVTAGGILFIAATRDGKLRAFNKRTGKLLWQTDLPTAGFATPSVYEVNGKQYIVIACGGGKLRTKSGDAYVAFTLANK
jgi:quinoprotein glucose dehydrogenase